MRKKTFIYWLIGCLLMTAVFYACKKLKTIKSDHEIARLTSIYEELSRRHNDFLARSFTSIKEKLLARKSTRTLSPVTETEMRDIVLHQSSLSLVPVLGSVYTPDQVLFALNRNLPADLTLQHYASTADCILDNAPGTSLSLTFIQALKELDQVLNRCYNYNDSINIISSFDQLLNKYAPYLTTSCEQEAFIAGIILGKYSFRYWAHNEKNIMEMYGSSLLANEGDKTNPVQSDVRGTIRGAVQGALTGGVWGSVIPGIGTLSGVIAGGIIGSMASGCVGSLAAGLWNALF